MPVPDLIELIFLQIFCFKTQTGKSNPDVNPNLYICIYYERSVNFKRTFWYVSLLLPKNEQNNST